MRWQSRALRRVLLGGAALFMLLLPSLSISWTFYRWEDERGIIHFTNTFTNIPKAYRDRVKTIEPKRKPITSVRLPAAPSVEGAAPSETQAPPEEAPAGAPAEVTPPQEVQKPTTSQERVSSKVLLMQKQIERDRKMLERETDGEVRKAIEKRIRQKEHELEMQRALEGQF